MTNRLGATGEFQLAGDPKLSIRTWAENPDPTKYTIIKSGDQRTGFHGRLSRTNEAWNFTAGINRITNGQVVLQEKPNSVDYLLKPEAERETGDALQTANSHVMVIMELFVEVFGMTFVTQVVLMHVCTKRTATILMLQMLR